MRGIKNVLTLTLILNLFCLQSLAVTKTVSDFHVDSQKLMNQAETKRGFEEKSKYLMQLEKALKTTLAEYKKKNPEKPDKQERELALFKARLSSAFELAKLKKAPDAETCARHKQQVYSDANIDIEENPTIHPEVQETLKWIEVLCSDVVKSKTSP